MDYILSIIFIIASYIFAVQFFKVLRKRTTESTWEVTSFAGSFAYIMLYLFIW